MPEVNLIILTVGNSFIFITFTATFVLALYTRLGTVTYSTFQLKLHN